MCFSHINELHITGKNGSSPRFFFFLNKCRQMHQLVLCLVSPKPYFHALIWGRWELRSSHMTRCTVTSGYTKDHSLHPVTHTYAVGDEHHGFPCLSSMPLGACMQKVMSVNLLVIQYGSFLFLFAMVHTHYSSHVVLQHAMWRGNRRYFRWKKPRDKPVLYVATLIL